MSGFDFSPERCAPTKRRKFHPIGIFIVCILGLAILGYWFSGPAIPPGSFYCERYRTVDLHVDNPRNAGERVVGYGYGPSGVYGVTKEHFRYDFRVCVFHAADGAEPKVVSRLVVSYWRGYSPFDRTVIRMVCPMSYFHSMPGNPFIDIPEREVGGRTIVLLLPLDEKLGWRLLRFDTRDVPDSIRVEDLAKLPRADADADGTVCIPIARKLARVS